MRSVCVLPSPLFGPPPLFPWTEKNKTVGDLGPAISWATWRRILNRLVKLFLLAMRGKVSPYWFPPVPEDTEIPSESKMVVVLRMIHSLVNSFKSMLFNTWCYLFWLWPCKLSLATVFQGGLSPHLPFLTEVAGDWSWEAEGKCSATERWLIRT